MTNKFPKHELFLTGDFHINLFSSNSKNFSNLLLSRNLYPTIFFPTKQTQNFATLIDNVFTIITAVWNSGILDCNLSDYYMIST